MQYTSFKKILATLAIATVACFMPANTMAQAARAGAALPPGQNPTDYRIIKLTPLDKDWIQKAQNINGRASAKAWQWGAFDVSFMTQPEWIEELTITYSVMFKNDKPLTKTEKTISLFQTTVVYPLIQQGRDHKCGVVLPANLAKRYGKPIGFAVQFNVGGKEVAAEGIGVDILKGRDKWWVDQRIVDAPTVERREGLIDRMKSPFQLVDIELYEMSR